jgi:hypothetical protein
MVNDLFSATAASFTGELQLSFTVYDGTINTTASISLTVESVNDGPTITQTSTTTVDEAGTPTVTFAVNGIDDTATFTGTAENGTVVVNDDGEISYTPNTDYNGTDDTITLTENIDQWASSSTASSQWSHSNYAARQAAGHPNTGLNVGDNQVEHPFAWAELGSQRTTENTLDLTYPTPVNITQIVARETYNAGSISKVEVLKDGVYVTVYSNDGTTETD